MSHKSNDKFNEAKQEAEEKKCPMCQTVDELAPSRSYCPEHNYSNPAFPETGREWEGIFDNEFTMNDECPITYPDAEKIKVFIRQELATARVEGAREEREKNQDELSGVLKIQFIAKEMDKAIKAARKEERERIINAIEPGEDIEKNYKRILDALKG